MKKFDQINVIPFIDIMLVLLAIVLMTATFISQGKIKVKLPKSSSQTSIQQKDMDHLITINQQGVFFYQGKIIDIDRLDLLLSKWSANNPHITLKVDSNASFQHFVAITDLLTQKGLNNVSVLSKKQVKAH